MQALFLRLLLLRHRSLLSARSAPIMRLSEWHLAQAKQLGDRQQVNRMALRASHRRESPSVRWQVRQGMQVRRGGQPPRRSRRGIRTRIRSAFSIRRWTDESGTHSTARQRQLLLPCMRLQQLLLLRCRVRPSFRLHLV